MAKRYPNLKVILVPQKDEFGLLGTQNRDTSFVLAKLKELDIHHSVCQLSYADYMPIDGHPNKIGYNKIFNCLSEFILDDTKRINN